MALSEKSTQMAWTANLCSSLISESCQEITQKKDTNSTNCVHREQKCLRCICVTEDITRALPSFAFTSFGVHEMILCVQPLKESMQMCKTAFSQVHLSELKCWPTHLFSNSVHLFSYYTPYKKTAFLKATKEKDNRMNNRTNK